MAGIYIHIPFCKQACTYCDFHFSTTFDKYRETLLDRMNSEIESRQSYLKEEPVETIYFGGGTPSILTIEEISKFLDQIHNHFEVTSEAEITLEANPDDITDEKLNEWKNAGINRLSIGVQSFMQEDLDWMNRAHTAEESLHAVQLAFSYGFSLTVDLIYGLPNRTLKDWENNIRELISLNPEHISAYCLTVEEKTVLDKWVKKGKVALVSEENQAEQFLLLLQLLEEAGYSQYEISNFAREGQFSRHNSNYWKGVSYLGIGPSAHSFDGESRRWNVSNNMNYIKGIEKKQNYFEEEVLSSKDKYNELLMTGLRTVWGVNLEDLKRIHDIPEEFVWQASLFQKNGLLIVEKNLIKLTKKGRLQADYIASALFLG